MIVAEKRTARSWLSGIGALLLFFACAAFTAAGAATALGYSARPRIVGWLSLVLSVGVSVWSMQQWARTLPGILGCAALNGFIITISGHALNQQSVPVNRSMAAVATIAVGLSAYLATTFTDRPLTILDRILGLGILAGFALAFSPSQLQVLGLVGIVLCVLVAWSIGRHHSTDAGKHRA